MLIKFSEQILFIDDSRSFFAFVIFAYLSVLRLLSIHSWLILKTFLAMSKTEHIHTLFLWKKRIFVLLHWAKTLQFIALEFPYPSSSERKMSSVVLEICRRGPFLHQSRLLEFNVVYGPTYIAMYSARKNVDWSHCPLLLMLPNK